MSIIHVCCGSFTPPTAEHECREVMWSEGRSCRTCPLKSCYRNGWKKAQVSADNRKLFENKVVK